MTDKAEKRYDVEFIMERMKKTDTVFLNRFTGTMYFYDPDDDDIVYRGYNDTPWGTSDALLFSFKLDDIEVYDDMTPAEALELLQKRISNKPCIGFTFPDVVEAYRHMKYTCEIDYGGEAYGHYLYTWDDGERFLARCKNCGGYILVQRSEYHSFTDDPDSYYTDLFPVSSPEEADELNRKYDGFAIERKFKGRYLAETNNRICWIDNN